jgi:hypothetical protein|nr:MAG TPA: hypothetical protein [Caudoviricetes sp.]
MSTVIAIGRNNVGSVYVGALVYVGIFGVGFIKIEGIQRPCKVGDLV